jgi:hypothetical protein
MPEHTEALKTYQCPILIKQKVLEKEESIDAGTDYKHQRANDYSTQQHRNSNNSSSTKLMASKHSYKALHLRNPLTVPCGRRSRK